MYTATSLQVRQIIYNIWKKTNASWSHVNLLELLYNSSTALHCTALA